MKNEGLHTHRFDSNPEERTFAEAWDAAWMASAVSSLGWLLGGGTEVAEVSDHDREVAATVIQWLGSPVGQGFLSDLGYEKKRVVRTNKRSD